MMAGTKQTKQSLLYNKVVYIAIPKRLYVDAIVKRALAHIKTHKPLAVIDPRDVFSSNEEWEKAFPRYLKPCEVCIVVTDNGIVGRGVYREVEYFQGKRLSCFQYVENDGVTSLAEIAGLHIINWNNWIDYAEVQRCA